METTEKRLFNVLLSEDYHDKFDKIAKNEHRKKSDLLRKWIDENFKEEYVTKLEI